MIKKKKKKEEASFVYDAPMHVHLFLYILLLLDSALQKPNLGVAMTLKDW